MKITLDFGYYDGEVVDEKFHGYGIFYYNNGDRYDGEWANDKMNGYGVYYAASGSIYRGQWKDDKKYLGKQEYSWGYYDGQWANGTWGGQGKEVIYGGATYEGYWIDSKTATNITCTYSDGRVSHGNIENGTFKAN